MRRKQMTILTICVFALSAIFTININMNSVRGIDIKSGLPGTESIGKACLAGALISNVSYGEEAINNTEEAGIGQNEETGSITNNPAENIQSTSGEVNTNTENIQRENQKENNAEIVKSDEIDLNKPYVIIYHTHATESYQPSNQGNFHILEENGSVREVGEALANRLRSHGIQVIHDKTIHDNPSYNKSYSRSLETIAALLEQYPNPVMVIDLHRDAAGYAGGKGKTTIVNGETAAKYGLVVGKGNPNYQSLKQFAQTVNKKAEELYPGFGGRIIDKEYKYNQYVYDRHILLEVGNNENNIREADVCGWYFADVVAAMTNV